MLEAWHFVVDVIQKVLSVVVATPERSGAKNHFIKDNLKGEIKYCKGQLTPRLKRSDFIPYL